MRKHSKVPIIVYGPYRSATLIVLLEAGADRYISFPCSKEEFCLQIAATLRLAKGLSQFLVSGELRVELLTQKVFVKEQEVSLTPSEYKILVFLMRSPGQAFDRYSLLRAGWGVQPHKTVLKPDDIVKQHIRQLRSKLGLPDYIETVRGYGYRFVNPQSPRQLQKRAAS